MTLIQSQQAAIYQAYMHQDAEQLAHINTGLEAAIEAGKKLKADQGKLREYVILYIWNMHYLGKVLNEVAPHGGDRSKVADVTLLNLGIPKHLSAKARKFAEIHEEDIRTFIEDSGDEINISYLLRLHTESTTEPKGWDEQAAQKTIVSMMQDYMQHGNDWLAAVSEFLYQVGVVSNDWRQE